MPDVPMPRLSDSMEEGTVLNWLKQVGDEVAAGEELVEIETDKANMVYESDLAGTVLEILVQEGESAPVGAVIARVGDADAEVRSAGKEEEQGPAGEHVGSFSDPAPLPPQAGSSGSEGSGRVKASPLARRVALKLGVDIASVEGTGPGGRVIKADVVAASESPKTLARDAAPAVGVVPAVSGAPVSAETAKGAVTTVELSKLQQVVARRMAESKATAPHFYLQAEVDMTAAAEARGRLKAAAGEGEAVATINDMVVKACALALRRFPLANGSYRDGQIELHSRVNVGIAVAAEDALVVPTVFDADRKGLGEICADSRRLAAAVKDGSITPPELAGGTFTVSNLGMFGVANFAAVVNSPQAAILAVGALSAKPAVVDGELVARQMMGVTLSCDHRILYGAEGARFLAAVRATLEEPVSLAL